MRQLRLFPIAVLHRGFLSSLAPTLVPLVNFLYVIILVLLLLPPSKRHHHHDQPLAFNCLLAALSPLVISLSLLFFFLFLCYYPDSFFYFFPLTFFCFLNHDTAVAIPSSHDLIMHVQ